MRASAESPRFVIGIVVPCGYWFRWRNARQAAFPLRFLRSMISGLQAFDRDETTLRAVLVDVELMIEPLLMASCFQAVVERRLAFSASGVSKTTKSVVRTFSTTPFCQLRRGSNSSVALFWLVTVHPPSVSCARNGGVEQLGDEGAVVHRMGSCEALRHDVEQLRARPRRHTASDWRGLEHACRRSEDAERQVAVRTPAFAYAADHARDCVEM